MAARGEQFRSKAIAGRIGIRKGPVISSPKKSTAYRFSRNCCRIILESLSSTGAVNNVINVRQTCAIFVVCCLFCFLSWPPGRGYPFAPIGPRKLLYMVVRDIGDLREKLPKLCPFLGI